MQLLKETIAAAIIAALILATGSIVVNAYLSHRALSHEVAALEQEVAHRQALLDVLQRDCAHLLHHLPRPVACYDSKHMSAWDVVDTVVARLEAAGHPVRVHRGE